VHHFVRDNYVIDNNTKRLTVAHDQDEQAAQQQAKRSHRRDDDSFRSLALVAS